MKIKQETIPPAFVLVTITLESQREIDDLYSLLYVVNLKGIDSLYEAFNYLKNIKSEEIISIIQNIRFINQI